VVGLDDVRGGPCHREDTGGLRQTRLTKFHKPADEKGACPAPANRLGIRHIAFVVNDLDTIVNGLRAKGRDLSVVGGTRCGFGPLSDGGLR
jgi:hypothetical protein